jgi:hypothetical protein
MARPAPLRVSFDLDDTLVCDAGVPSEHLVPLLYRRRYPERLRLGTRDLMRALEARGCRLWLYTTSGRPVAYLEGWFRSLGVRLEGVVNQVRHAEVVGCRGPSKLPSAFGIGLHVDDSEGVAMEARAHGFRALVLSPHDRDWVERVLSAVEALRAESEVQRGGIDLVNLRGIEKFVRVGPVHPGLHEQGVERRVNVASARHVAQDAQGL